MQYDVVVIGGGVIGSFIARELKRYELAVCVLEAEDDLAFGASGANSGIVHGGFDPEPGTLKARFNIEGNRMMDTVTAQLCVPYKKIGSLVCAHHESEIPALHKLAQRGQVNGVKGLRILTAREIASVEPHLAGVVKGALYCPESGIVSPYELTIAAAENAVQNGAVLRFDSPVTDLRLLPGGGWEVRAGGEALFARCIVNAAGLYADAVHALALKNIDEVSARKKEFKIAPRRGEYMLLDKSQGPAVRHVIFRIPNEKGKGILASPTVDGNLLLGPTSISARGRDDKETTPAGLAQVREETLELKLPIDFREMITAFAGVRASCGAAGGDFIIGESLDGFYNVAGIDSPGLTAAPAIGVYIAREIAGKLHASENRAFDPACRPRVRFSEMTDAQRAALIEKDPTYANVICRCETVTEGEIIDAIRRPAGARTIDGVKKRTRAGMGRCQGGFCMPKVTEILAREKSISPLRVLKSKTGSALLTGYLKES